MRERYLAAHAHDLVDVGQLDLEVDRAARRVVVEWQLESKTERGQVDHGGVAEVLASHDATQPVDRDPRRESAGIEEAHSEIVESS